MGSKSYVELSSKTYVSAVSCDLLAVASISVSVWGCTTMYSLSPVVVAVSPAVFVLWFGTSY